MAAGWFWVLEDEPDAEDMCQNREPSRLYGEVIPKLDLLVLLAGKVSCRWAVGPLDGPQRPRATRKETSL